MAFAALVLGFPAGAAAGSGQVEINQVRVLEGGISPGDTAGFPVTLSASGSYRLTSDLLVRGANADSTSAIIIEARNVTLDLGGFTLRCEIPNIPAPLPCSSGNGGGTGIRISGAPFARVRNGTIRHFGGSGVNIVGSSQGFHVSHLRLQENGTTGLSSNANGIFSHSTSLGHSFFGVDSFGGGLLILDVATSGNVASGIRSLFPRAAVGSSVLPDKVQNITPIDCNRVEGTTTCP